jgi:hypothetical protein
LILQVDSYFHLLSLPRQNVYAVVYRYNAKTIDMPRKPIPVRKGRSIIIEERRLGIHLPGSVREWRSEMAPLND